MAIVMHMIKCIRLFASLAGRTWNVTSLCNNVSRLSQLKCDMHVRCPLPKLAQQVRSLRHWSGHFFLRPPFLSTFTYIFSNVIYLFTCLFIDLLIYLFICLFVYSFINLFIHFFIRLFAIHTFIHYFLYVLLI